MRLAIISILLILLLGCIQSGSADANTSMDNQSNATSENSTDNKMPGGDEDEHGCIASAGYTWCDVRNECIRLWEVPCRLTLEDALDAALRSECADSGRVSGENAFFNNNSKTWWLSLESNKSGCNPACVVYENRSAEINWRCTGLDQ